MYISHSSTNILLKLQLCLINVHSFILSYTFLFPIAYYYPTHQSRTLITAVYFLYDVTIFMLHTNVYMLHTVFRSEMAVLVTMSPLSPLFIRNDSENSSILFQPYQRNGQQDSCKIKTHSDNCIRRLLQNKKLVILRNLFIFCVKHRIN